MAEKSVPPHSRLTGLLALSAVAAIVFGVINLFQTFGPTRFHDDGPLGSLSGASFAFDSTTTGPWTSGYELCLEQGSDPVILESVSPATPVGGGLHYLGAFVREIPGLSATANRTGAIGTAAGFPPTVSESLEPVAGHAVTHQCDDNGPLSPYTELDVGVGRLAASASGGWMGFTADYRVGLIQYVATWDTGLYACGSSTPASTPTACAIPAQT